MGNQCRSLRVRPRPRTDSTEWILRTAIMLILYILVSVTQYHSGSQQELIRRWDSERELFYDDIAHVFQNTKKENSLPLTN